MEVGEEGDCYTYRYTVTTRMIPALRWAVMRAEKKIPVLRVFHVVQVRPGTCQ